MQLDRVNILLATASAIATVATAFSLPERDQIVLKGDGIQMPPVTATGQSFEVAETGTAIGPATVTARTTTLTTTYTSSLHGHTGIITITRTSTRTRSRETATPTPAPTRDSTLSSYWDWFWNLPRKDTNGDLPSKETTTPSCFCAGGSVCCRHGPTNTDVSCDYGMCGI
ncbi:hypothetical protein B0T17DRAFT_507935 [Bombardia bombarda]|uniref:Uncharacterized protein n=1 Tax=Bombardia bombarda TaxID=252184 RepID=A0AA39X092_9PEZI|nr:hypothetical protein B0T17DRAFT_507935 [Bombardia bombarda]